MALMSYLFFDMPIEFCYSLGFSIACIAPGILVPAMLNFND